MTLIEELGIKPSWMAKASCATGHDPDDWYPQQGTPDYEERKQRALSVCKRCPVRVQCLRHAMKTEDEIWGIAGGLSQHSRSRIRTRLRKLGRRS
jgi:WhiB family transcriptional regulator, redox-sensing transcriptional regulator